MSSLQSFLTTRYQEVEEFLALIRSFELAAQDGAPRVGGAAITPTQYRMLFASAYLQMYNMVEATMSQCIDELERALASGTWKVADLQEEFRREWVKHFSGRSAELSLPEREKRAWKLCNHLLADQPFSKLSVHRGGSGNWHDERIEEFLTKVGIRHRPSGEILAKVRPRMTTRTKPLQAVCKTRNDLAHGSLSFASVRPNDTFQDVLETAQTTKLYLDAIVGIFDRVIRDHEFLVPTRRPPSRQSASA